MIFFCGDMILNTGPANVNRAYRDELKGRMYFLRSGNRVLSFLEAFFATLFSEKIVVSGVNSRTFLALCLGTLLHKNVIYLMHGYTKKEAEINRESPKPGLIREEAFLEKSSQIICVSERYMELCKGWFPALADKMTFVNNGVTRIAPPSVAEISRNRDYIVTTGGGRPIKGNLNTARAIQHSNAMTGSGLRLIVLGREYQDSEALRQCACADYVGQVAHDEVYAYFQRSSVFVQNSMIESFSISVFEALQCGCDIVLSKNIGCLPLLKGLSEDYIISDTEDIEEIARKIRYCIAHPNNKAICERIDWDAISCRAAADRLYAVVTGGA